MNKFIINSVDSIFEDHHFKHTKPATIKFTTEMGREVECVDLAKLDKNEIDFAGYTKSVYGNRENNKGTGTTYQYTTWSNALRGLMGKMIEQLDDTLELEEPGLDRNLKASFFVKRFNYNLQKYLKENDLPTNISFTKSLYTNEDDLRLSANYKNNKNHKLPICIAPEELNDPLGEQVQYYICAVYAGEVIYVLTAMARTMYEFGYNNTIEIDYYFKNNGNSVPDQQLSVFDDVIDEDDDIDTMYIKEQQAEKLHKEKVREILQQIQTYNLKVDTLISNLAKELDLKLLFDIDIK